MHELPDPSIAQVLAVPLRRRILDMVAASDDAVSVATLTDELGCNHNAVRQHLARLRQVGLVTETTEPRATPGRPRLVYRASTPPPDPYARLARLLLTMRKSGRSPLAVGRQQGLADAAHSSLNDPIDALETDAARNGFAPRRNQRGKRITLILDACPLADAADADPRTVCALHRGVAEGLVAGIGGARVEGFIARNPHQAGCRITLRRTP